MAPWRLLIFVAAVLFLKGSLSSEEVKDVHELRGKAWLNKKNLNYHSSGSDSEEHTKNVSSRDESTTNEDSSLYSDELGYTRSEAESTEDNQSKHEEQTVIYIEKDSVTREDDLSLYSDEQDYTESEEESAEDDRSQYEEHTMTYKGQDSIIKEDNLSQYSNEKDYIKNEAESIENDHTQLQEETVSYRGKDPIKMKDIFGDNWSQHKQGEKRSVRHDDWYNTHIHDPQWYKDSGEYYDKITDTPNKFSKTYYYTWPAALPYYLKSHKGLSTAKEEYLEDIKNFDEYPLLYTVQLRNDHHYYPLTNGKLVSYTHGPEDMRGQKLTALSDDTLLEKNIYYNKGIRIDEPERVKHIHPHHDVIHRWFPVNHNSIKTVFNSEDEITSHGTIMEDSPANFLKETKHILLAVENDGEDSRSKKLFSSPWYKPFYSNNKRIHSDSIIVKTESQPRNGLELLPQKYGSSGKYKCHCYKEVDEGGLFTYHDNYMLNKDSEKDTISYQFLEEWDKQHSDLTESDEVDVYDTYDSTVKYHPHITYVSGEDAIVDYTDEQDHTKITHEVGLKSDILDDQIINVHHTGVDAHTVATDSDMAEVNEEIIEEVQADKYIQEEFHPHSTNTVEEDGFFSKTQNHNHIEFVENSNLKVENLNDKVTDFQEMDTTALHQPQFHEEVIETVGQESVYEDHPHDTYSLEEDKVFDHTENDDLKDTVERFDLNVGTFNDKVIKLHEIDMTAEDISTESEEIIEEIVDSEVKYHPHDIYSPKEDSIIDYKGNHEYMEATDKENVEFATLNDPLIKLHEVNKLVPDKPIITEETVEEALDSAVMHYPQHSHGPEEDNFFEYDENRGYEYTEKGSLGITTLNDEIIKFHEKEAFATKKPMVYEQIIKEVGGTGVEYHPNYDYSSEEQDYFDYVGNEYHMGIIKNDHLKTDTFDEQIIRPYEIEKVPGIATIALNKPTVYEEISEKVADNAPHSYQPYYTHGEEKKEIFHHNQNHGYSEVFKTDNWKFGSVSELSDHILKFHETKLPPKSDHIFSHGYSVNDKMVDVSKIGSYMIPESEISLSKHTGDLTYDTEYDSRATHTAFLNNEHITDDIPQSETYEINGDIPYTRPFLLKEISEYDDVETLDEDSDEIDIDIGFPFLYEKEKGHHLDKFAETEDSTVITDNILEEADSLLISENNGNELLEENNVVEDIGSALLLGRTHSKQLTEHDVAMESDLEHDAISSLKNDGTLELPNESTIYNSGVLSAAQYETGDKLSMYNEEMNYEVDSTEHVNDEKIGISNPVPYEYNVANKHYAQYITEGGILQEKELMSANVAKYDINDEAERSFINEKNFEVTDDDYPTIKDISVPFPEKFPLPDYKIVQHHFHTKEPMDYDYHYSENKHNNNPLFVEENSSEIEQVAHDHNVEKNMAVKETEFMLDSYKTAPTPCNGYKYFPFYKYANYPVFVGEESREIEHVGHDYNVEKNIAVKGTEFSMDSFKTAPRPCDGYRCLPFYKHGNDPFFVKQKSWETEQAGHVYNVKKNIAVKGKEFSLDSFKGAPRPCNGYRCVPLYYPYLRGDMPHWQTTPGKKYFSDLYTVPTSSNAFIPTADVKKYPWPFHTQLKF